MNICRSTRFIVKENRDGRFRKNPVRIEKTTEKRTLYPYDRRDVYGGIDGDAIWGGYRESDDGRASA